MKRQIGFVSISLWLICLQISYSQCLQNTLTPTNYLTIQLNPNDLPADQDVADFNSDGRPDLAVANSYSKSVSILLNTGNGSVGSPTNFSLTSSPYVLVAADFNTDGKLDLAVGKGYPEHAVAIFLNTGNGTFGTPTDFQIGGNPLKVVVGEFNGDGKPDLAVVNTTFGGGPTLNVLLNTGNGNFGTSTYSTTGPISDIVASDFDGDAKNDLILQLSGGISLLKGLGDGTFSTPTVLFSTNVTPFAVHDFNSDGKVDLVVAINGVTILLNQGNGTVGNGTAYAVGVSPTVIITADFNNDSKIDIGVVGKADNALSVIKNVGNGSFGAYVTYKVGLQPIATRTGDFNGDGYADITVLNQGNNHPANTVSLLTNTGNGSFGSASNVSVDFGAGPASDYSDQSQLVMVSDFTNDTKPDLILIRSSTISLLANTGSGAFGTLTDLAVLSALPNTMASGDLNGDGKPDLAISKNNSSISVILNGISGVAYEVPAGSPLRKVAIGDMNADGKADLVVLPTSSNNSVIILFNLGNNNFSTASTFAVDLFPSSLQLADVNADGKLDIVTANQNNTSQQNGTISVLINNGNGGFSAATNYQVNINPRSIVSADFTGDGKPDFATVSFVNNSIAVIMNLGNGTFGTATIITVGSQPSSMAVADLNNDGKLDIVVTNRGGGNLSILLNSGNGSFVNAALIGVGDIPTTVVTADFNNDGTNDFAVAVASTVASYRVMALFYGCPMPMPSVQITPSVVGTICSGNMLSLTATAALFTPTAYTWNSQPTGFSSSVPMPQFVTPTVSTVTAYTLTVSATDGIITKMASLVVSVMSSTMIYTIKNGSWDDPSIWTCGQIPTSVTNVRLKNVITIPNNYTANALKISFDSGVKLQYGTNAKLKLNQ